MNSIEFNSESIDRLRELFNIGAGNAANTVSILSGVRVTITVPELYICKFPELNRYIGETGREMVGIYHNISGGLAGKVLFLISKNSGEQLTELLIQQYSVKESSEADFANTLKEFSNIITGSYLNALSTMIGKKILHSIPFLAVDMVGALLDSVIATVAEKEDFVVILKTLLTGDAGVFDISFIFFPESDSLNRIIKA